MKPEFLIIGAQKSGTTSLADGLARHPGIFVAEPREPEYFSRTLPGRGEGGMSWGEYERLFEGVEEGVLCGEASTGTMVDAGVIPEIDRRLPGVRLIAILRKPESRAYSGFTHSMKKGRVSTGEGTGLFEEEAERYLRGEECRFDWFARSEYARQLEPFARHFGERLKIVIFEELLADQERGLAEILGFLEVPPGPVALTKENQSRVPRGRFTEGVLAMGRRVVGPLRNALGEKGYRRFRESVMKRLGKQAAPLDPALVKRLREQRYGEDIRNLERMLGRSIKGW